MTLGGQEGVMSVHYEYAYMHRQHACQHTMWVVVVVVFQLMSVCLRSLYVVQPAQGEHKGVVHCMSVYYKVVRTLYPVDGNPHVYAIPMVITTTFHNTHQNHTVGASTVNAFI